MEMPDSAFTRPVVHTLTFSVKAECWRTSSAESLLSGFGTRADISDRAQISGNFGPGLTSVSQAHAWVRATGTGTNTSVSNNEGGPTAFTGGSIDAGQCTPSGVGIRPNVFTNNHLGGFYDVRAEDGSTVAARYAYWGGRTTLVLVEDKSSTATVYPVAPSASSPDPTCPTSWLTRGSAPVSSDRLVRDDYASTESARGNVTAAVVALARNARQAAWDGDPDAAFGLLDQARVASITDDDREAVYEAIGALVAAYDSAATVPDVVASLEATASTQLEDALWARRALAVAYAMTNRVADAEVLAEDLTVGSAATTHAVFGHGLLVRLAVDADSAELAVERLTAFSGVVVPSDTPTVEAFASSLALVAASFPAMDLSAVAGSAAKRVSQAASSLSATDRSIADEVSVYPNPVTDRGIVRVSVSGTVSVTASAYDALGRRVALLYDGPLGPGAHDVAFDVSRLAPGLYVVQVRVVPDGSLPSIEIRPVTIVR